MPGKRTNIRELARLSGVSVGTVSRALNGYTDVSDETRERVIRLAAELDYTPTAAARTLVTQRSHVIGVFLETGEGHPDLQHPFFHEVLVGLKDCIGAAGYDLLLFASSRPGNGYGDHSYLKRCRHHNVDGAVLMGVDADDPEVRRLLRSELPCVGVDVELEGACTAYVMSDNAIGAAAAVRHLHGLGHRRIATITGLLDKKPGIDRLRGYRDACQALGLGFRDEYVAYGDFYFEAGQEAARRLLALDEPPTAIFAASDMMAIGAVRAAFEAGLTVPDDLSVVGFDDMQIAEHVHPPLTTVAQDKAGLGVAAARALLRQVDGADGAETVTLPVELVVRRSTVAPGGG
jgi:LacI family transcriptional regulator